MVNVPVGVSVDEYSFFDPPEPGDEEQPFLTCIISHPQGLYCEASIVDKSENAVIFEVDKELVEKGYFKDTYIDSRDFEILDLKWYIVPHFHLVEC